MTHRTSPHSLEFELNGQRVPIEGCAVQTTLLDFVRDRGLTGAKEGCAEGECGACTVLLVENHGTGSAYRPINSCLAFVPAMAGREIYTVESLAEQGKLADAQRAIAEAAGSQCGYCTPGFVVSLFAEQYRPDRKGPCDPSAMGGNLCRCTGYRPIRDAALSLGAAPEGAFKDRLLRPAPGLESANYESGASKFDRPSTVEECVAIAAKDPDVRWIAGATDLGVESNLRGHRWTHLVSLEGVGELQKFVDLGTHVRIGAGLSLNEIGRQWTNAPETLHEWLLLFASPPIRNRATLGGNLATASPIGDSAPFLLSLDAAIEIAGLDGRRRVPLSSFFLDYRKTRMGVGEMITAVEIPKPLPAYTRFYKVAKRRVDDISTVAAGISMEWDGAGRVQKAILAFGGVAAVPTRIFAAEEAILGERWNPSAVERAKAALDRALKPISDHRGSAEYRVEVAKSLIDKFFWEREEAAA